MIGLTVISGRLENSTESLNLIKGIHSINSLAFQNFDYANENFLGTVILRAELAENNENIFWENKEFAVFIEGYICPSEKTRINHPEYILRNWLSTGIDFIKHLNGEYNICIYNKTENICTIFNDRFASRNFFYTQIHKKLYFGSEIKSILVHFEKSPAISDAGLMEFFSLSHNIKDETIFEGIKALKPATIIQAGNNSFIINNYWNLQYSESKTQNSAEEMATILRSAAEKRYTGKKKIGLGLSGGLDSRVIAVTIPADVRPVFARTYGAKDSMEVIVASEIAKRLKFDHFIHTPKEVLFSDFLYPSVWRTECSVHFTGLKSIIEHKFLKDKMLYNLGGQFGDVLTGKQLRPFMFYPFKKAEFINKVFNHYTSYTFKDIGKLKKIFNPDFFNSAINDLKERFSSSFGEIDAENNADLYDSWDLINRQSRFTFSSSRVDNYLFYKIKLFTDYDYVDLMLKIPARYRFGQNLYKKMIATQFPELKNIPNANSGRTIKSSIILNSIDLLNQYLNKTTKKNNYQNEGSKRNLIIKDLALKKIIEQFINDSSFPSHIFSSIGILEIINDHYNGKKNYEYLIGVLATFIAAYNLFFINNYKTIPDIANPFNIK